MKKAGVVATEGYYRGPPQIIKLDVECTGEPKVKISPVLSKETVFYKGKQHVQFNSMYVCTLKVASQPLLRSRAVRTRPAQTASRNP